MTCATRNYQHMRSQARSRGHHHYDQENDKSSGIIFLAFVVAIVALYHYSRRQGARPIRITQGWYTLGKQMDTSNAPPDDGALDTTDSDSIPAARRAHCAAELRGAKTLLARGGRNVDVRRTKARIRELEAQLQPT
ncbi:hypothetical protein C8F04DRAFT_1399768 [Mycena alexandri]|uniref:Uncharacterized protein n=1 Tax=Mycena alexandri TaxID=1745969 RepID=A0AAD6SGQ5_9AGAR|nr:hypothetical protein C8F04DRAFT_1399768 [Mycena alexandri]